jgi:single-stranded-DNA-specific exonuclease
MATMTWTAQPPWPSSIGFLKDLGQFDYYIPDRYAEGYGLSSQGIDFAAEHGFSLIITLDCGIRAVDKVAYAKEKGIDLIICDHHLPGPEMPDAVAVLDPKRPDCPYPYKELCGCGVGFKFMQAFCEAGGLDKTPLFAHLDLLAVAIAADIVAVTGENRILAHFGMQVLNSAPCTGIQSAAGKCECEEGAFHLRTRCSSSGHASMPLGASLRARKRWNCS